MSLGVEVDSGNLLGMLDNLGDTLKDEAGGNSDGPLSDSNFDCIFWSYFQIPKKTKSFKTFENVR